ncbi:DUF2290 domain-containing protein [Myroides odoratimimus]|uniref:DUF2290 domain-containing protein n=1 Tax=Myroides odoratimimus TaxID=76832 RepID=A0AAI8C930_9FLAO|nr:DUF2290 domain-containing protein [Myroides odoratimimus]ALU28222.1 hypothetical protein AS202_19640 [Myroides odoratimimus]MDM1039844.1 DUF2290 domain-containing protein [Myroides odoratimimus]MDM1054084.1 DUF2290 domain-containing protein [Myroides odoratimimus]
MTQGKFISSINESIDLLNKFKLLKSKGPKGNGIYSEEFLKISKKKNIVETYKCAIKNEDYDILLKDESIIQFQKKSDDLRYAYIQNPYIFYSKEEYLNIIYTREELDEFSEFGIDELVNENEYEQFLNEQRLNSTSNYFRYDCSPAGYEPLIHSYSHFHIGMNENTRIATSKIITPLKFTKFCIKNTYFEDWKSQFVKDPIFITEVIKMKHDCLPLPIDKWDNIETNDLYLL